MTQALAVKFWYHGLHLMMEYIQRKSDLRQSNKQQYIDIRLTVMHGHKLIYLPEKSSFADRPKTVSTSSSTMSRTAEMWIHSG